MSLNRVSSNGVELSDNGDVQPIGSVISDELRANIRIALTNAEHAIKRLEKARAVDPESLLKPMTR